MRAIEAALEVHCGICRRGPTTEGRAGDRLCAGDAKHEACPSYVIFAAARTEDAERETALKLADALDKAECELRAAKVDERASYNDTFRLAGEVDFHRAAYRAARGS